MVDDNEDGAESLAMFLQIGGHEVKTAYDGEQALAMAEAFRPDVVLLDIGMPKLNGYEACRRIRESGFTDQLVIAVTGYGQDEDRRLCREAGFDDHVVKPIGLSDLEKILVNQELAFNEQRRVLG